MLHESCSFIAVVRMLYNKTVLFYFYFRWEMPPEVLIWPHSVSPWP